MTTNSYAIDPVSVTHWDFQVVNADGSSAYSGTAPVVIEGIVLNSPEEWLDPASDINAVPYNMGGEWEMFIQGVDGDHAGTAVWIGQNYGNLGGGDPGYTEQEWKDELYRVNRDPNTGYIFHPGDLVRVTGKHLFYAGKRNVNENHKSIDTYDFDVRLVKPAVGLPMPESVTLEDLVDATNTPIFDDSRESGCEFYQMQLIRIEGVTITNPTNFGPESTITIADGTGRTFPVFLCRGEGFSRYNAPTGKIDVIGIMDQKAPTYPSQDLTKGYRLLVMNYDGNGQVLTHRAARRGNNSADVNSDYQVNLYDLAQMASSWLTCTEGLDCD